MKTLKTLSQITIAGIITVAVVFSSQGDGQALSQIPLCGNLNDTFSTGTDNWSNRYSTFHPLGFVPEQQTDGNGDFLLIQSRIPSPQQGTLVTTFQNIVTPYTPKLGVFNSEQWKCNASQVNSVQVDVINPTSSPIDLTFILLNGFTDGPRPTLTEFFSPTSPLRLNISQYGAKPQVVPAGTNTPMTLTFSLNQSNMVPIGGPAMSYAQVRNNVSKVFIRQAISSTDLEPPSVNASLKIYGVRTQ